MTTLKILHVCPTYFDETSYIGGAERYTWELAKAMAAKAEVELITFGRTRRTVVRHGVTLRTLGLIPVVNHPLFSNPFTPAFVQAVRRADVVHAYQVHCLATDASIAVARLFGRKVFVSDLGGGDVFAPSNYLPLTRRATGLLLPSFYSRQMWLDRPRRTRPDRLEVIYGGVDPVHFSPAGEKDPSLVVYVGRLVPHKGLEHLIDAVVPPLTLRLVGRPYDQEYLAFLRDKARGKPVIFEHDLDDAAILDRYRRALVFGLPSVATDFRGRTTQSTELFGLVLVEAMACGTPPIVTREASHPEIIQDGVTGMIVPPADPLALRAKLLEMHARPEEAIAMRLAKMVGKRTVRRMFGRLIPFAAIAFNAVANERDTRALADRAIRFYGG